MAEGPNAQGPDTQGPHTEGPSTEGLSTEDVGSVADEAAKLFGALQDWARQAGHEQANGAKHAAAGIGAAAQDVADHLAHGQDCRYCPVCQAISLVRSTSPEVRTHLAVAANSLLQAASTMLAPNLPKPGASASDGVEKISLSDDDF